MSNYLQSECNLVFVALAVWKWQAKNAKKINHEEVNYLVTLSTKDMLASRKARNFFEKANWSSSKKSFKDKRNLAAVALIV